MKLNYLLFVNDQVLIANSKNNNKKFAI